MAVSGNHFRSAANWLQARMWLFHSLHGIVTMKSLAFNTLKRAHRWQR